MRLLRPRALARTSLAAGVVGAGLLTAGAWYAGARGETGAFVAGLTRQVSAQGVQPPAPTTPVKPGAKMPHGGNARRPSGQVTRITPDQPGFTIQTADGAALTYRVEDGTVFMAGRDRPYRFELLRVGDQVVVRGGQGIGANGAGAPKPRAAARPRNKPTSTTGQHGTAADDPVARQVMVKPAGEGARGKKNAAAPASAPAQNGGSDGSGQ